MKLLEDIIDNLTNLIKGYQSNKGVHKANEILGEMDYPSFSSILPYRYIDKNNDLFINKSTTGFILEVNPLIGANELIVKGLDDFLRTKLPRNIPLTVTLLASKACDEIIEYGLGNFSWTGEFSDHFNKITKAFYKNAATKGFKNNANHSLYLRNYRVFISYSIKTKKYNDSDLFSIESIKKTICASLEAAKLQTKLISINEFLSILREITNYNPKTITKSDESYDSNEHINKQCVDNSFTLEVTPQYLRTTIKDKKTGFEEKTRIINLMMDKNPNQFYLWQGGNNISNILSPDLSIPCPFIISFIVEVEDQIKTQREASLKYFDYEKKANSKFATFIPGVIKQADEWKKIREHLNTNESALVKYYFNVTLFCEDDDSKALLNELKTINTYRKNGIELSSPKYMQMRNYLSIFPFMANEGLWDDIKITGASNRAESTQCVNLMPIIADNKLCQEGLLIPSYRNQIAFFDMFNEHLGNTNSNVAVTGTSGGGKSVLVQGIIRQVLNSQGIVWVFDMGNSYQSFCENVDGTYLDASKLKFNPFANVIDIKDSAESIVGLLAILASPDDKLDEVHRSLLLEAVENAWKRKQRKALIDDVNNYLKEIIEKQDQVISNRLNEIIKLLDKYTSTGIYGEYFNSEEPSLQEDTKFTVLELGALSDKPALLTAILCTLIIHIESRMYHSPRTQKKLCVIDEAWRLLAGENKQVENFIEKGYRTVRRHNGAVMTITQNIKDFLMSGAAKAAWGNSQIKITLKQDSSEFKEYNQNNPNQFNGLEKAVINNFGSAKDNGFSSFMLKVDNSTSFHRLFLDPLSRVMFSSTGKDYEFIRDKRKSGYSVNKAIYELAIKRYPEEMQELEKWIENHY